MRRFAAIALVVAVGSTAAFAGNMNVEISKGNFDLSAPADVMMGVTINARAPFDFADVIFGSNDVRLGDFIWDPAIPMSFTSAVSRDDLGVYASELFGSATNSTGVGPSLFLGTLMVSAADILAVGPADGSTLMVMVSNDNDFGISQVGKGGVNEALYGEGMINITPEPATLALLGLGTLGLIRRRKA